MIAMRRLGSSDSHELCGGNHLNDEDENVVVINAQTGLKALKFPPDFVWGTATASYQVEGAWDIGGRGLSIWDTFSRTLGGDTGDIACDHYFRYKEDFSLMKDLGFKNYRFSISWSRIQPTGTGPANQEGVAFYENILDSLESNGIKPLVTLYHWDLPQTLETNYQGWLNRDIVPAFVEFARLCFVHFGDRVKQWITINEPWCVCLLGYGTGEHAPGMKCFDGSKVYLAAHHVLLAHASAVDLHRRQFKSEQGGSIGIALNANWNEPIGDCNPETSKKNADAANRLTMWGFGWFADPIWLGNYPIEMRERCGDRLPVFTDKEKLLVHGSSDFLGLNHYYSDFVRESVASDFTSMWGVTSKGGYFGDMAATTLGHPTWSLTDMGWNVVPWGFKKLLLFCQNRYKPSGGIYVTENGCAIPELTKEASLSDSFRISYLSSYVAAMHEAMNEGSDVRGYFAWSFLDNFEWSLGYKKRFGIVHVDYKTQKRTPKSSAKWYSEVVKNNAMCFEHDALFTDATTYHY